MKKPKQYLEDMNLLIEDGHTVEAHTSLVVKAMNRYAVDYHSAKLKELLRKEEEKDETDKRTEV